MNSLSIRMGISESSFLQNLHVSILSFIFIQFQQLNILHSMQLEALGDIILKHEWHVNFEMCTSLLFLCFFAALSE